MLYLNISRHTYSLLSANLTNMKLFMYMEKRSINSYMNQTSNRDFTHFTDILTDKRI